MSENLIINQTSHACGGFKAVNLLNDRFSDQVLKLKKSR
jgi:hypothetical protein